MSATAEIVTVERPIGAQRRWNWKVLARSASVAVLVLSLLVGAVLGEPQALVTALLGLVIGLALVRVFFRADEREFLLSLFLLAFAARAALARPR